MQTQVTGLNDNGVTVGFWSDMNNANQVNDNFGFYSLDGRTFHSVNFPTKDNATPPVTSCSASTTMTSRPGSTPTGRATITATPTTSAATCSAR